MNILRWTIFAALAVGTTAALAQSPTKIGTFRDWGSFSYMDGGSRVCYAASQPTDSQPTNVNRDPTFFMVTTRPSENVREQASVIIGYPFRQGSTVTVEVDGQRFELFTQDDGAWISDDSERALIQAMRAGNRMVVKGTSHRGTLTTDTYSLLGISAALDSAARTCSS